MNKGLKEKILRYFSTTFFILVLATIPYELFFRKSFGDWPAWVIFLLFVVVFILALIAILLVVGFQVENPYCSQRFVSDLCWLLFFVLYFLGGVAFVGYCINDSTLPIDLYGILGALLGTHLVYLKNIKKDHSS